jgi:hypothetical protein
LRLVQTLIVRDEIDIVESQIAYHLNAGVDFVIATDHDSRDGTTDVLERYAKAGRLVRIPEHGENRESAWRTRMARLAATEYGADWVINTDADEFWIPRLGTLRETFAAVPEQFGIVHALSRHFPPRPDDDRLFAERMTVRASFPAAMNDPTSAYRPHAKVAHRADPEIVVRHGAHGARSTRLRTLSRWDAIEVIHFPFRTQEQWERKGVRRARADKPLGQYVKALRASEEARTAIRYRTLVVDEQTLRRGVADGSLAVDTRLRDALRDLRMDGRESRRVPGGAQEGIDGRLVAEAAGLQDADVVRLLRHVDLLSARFRVLEDRLARR